ncbi:MAG: HD-GYP domain-containing protein [Candidatus Thiodiazotropha sp. (ex Myrtea sp. 'scaly one' KF741663)]|nr:HD-GYP domain-containing protein [Candidatus Thiodiazotropha sp. (ex Myrtea sp. 'scaly one' KF741663)]
MDLGTPTQTIKQRRSMLEQHIGFKLDAIMQQILNARDSYTSKHCERVLSLSEAIGHKLQLNEHEIVVLTLSAGFHDIGKIGIPDHILLKPGKLEPQEYEIIKTHPQIGANILRSLGNPLLDEVAECILHHHEYWDGSGYPGGLSGEQIPLISQIISVVDAYDAMTTTRTYRVGATQEEALKVIQKGSGRHFCPDIVDVLTKLSQEVTVD